MMDRRRWSNSENEEVRRKDRRQVRRKDRRQQRRLSFMIDVNRPATLKRRDRCGLKSSASPLSLIGDGLSFIGNG